jgi:hypothetical protein
LHGRRRVRESAWLSVAGLIGLHGRHRIRESAWLVEAGLNWLAAAVLRILAGWTGLRTWALGLLPVDVALVFLHLHHLYPVPAYFAAAADQILTAVAGHPGWQARLAGQPPGGLVCLAILARHTP